MNFLTATVEVKVDSRGLPAQLSKVKRLTTRVATSITGAFNRMATNVIKSITRMVKYAALGLLALSVAAVKMASGVQESENLYEVSMGNMADATRKWSKEMSEALFLNEYEVRKNVATFNVMFDSMGMSSEAAAEMSKSLTQLTYDMASFYNLKPELAFQKLQAGITGETEPLKRLGILINETTVKQYALNKGLWDGVGVMTELGKVQARYLLIMEQTTKAQGDMERTLDSSQNVFRAIGTQVKLLVIALGDKLLIAFQDVAKATRDWLVTDREKMITGMIRGIQSMAKGVRFLTKEIMVMPMYWKEIEIRVLKLTLLVWKLGDAMAKVAIIPALIKAFSSDYVGGIEAMEEHIGDLEKQVKDMAVAYVKAEQDVDGFFNSIISGLEKAAETSEKSTRTLLEWAIESYRKKIALVDAEIAKNKEASDLVQKLAQRDRDVIIAAVQEQVDFVREQDYMTRTERIQNLQDYVTENQQALDLVLEANKIITDEIKRLERGKWDGVKRWISESGDLWLSLDRIAVRALDSISDTLADMVVKGKADFKSLAQSILLDITRMIIKMQLLNLMGLGGKTGWGQLALTAVTGGGGFAPTLLPAGTPSGLPPGAPGSRPGLQDGGYVEKTGWAKVHKGETYSGVGGAGGLDVRIYNESGVKLDVTEAEESDAFDQRILNVTLNLAKTNGGYRRAMSKIRR